MDVSTGPERNENNRSLLNTKIEATLTTDIGYKFNLYRAAAETNERKLKEAKLVIQQLEEYVKTAKEVEVNLKRQIECSGKRLIQLHKILSQFLHVSERQRQHAKTFQNIQKKLNEMDQEISIFRLKSKNVLESVSNEVHLLKKKQELQRALKTTQSSSHLLKIQYETLLNEKTEMEIQFQRQVDNLQNNLEQSRREATDMKTRCDTTILIYKKQIEDQQILIKEYERERQSLLEDFEIPTKSDTSKNFTTAIISLESTPAENTDESLSKLFKNGVANHISMTSPVFSEEINSQLVLKSSSCVEALPRCDMVKPLGQEEKQKPSLKFLPSQAPSVPTPSVGPPTKRRLFSTNCNHYLT